MINALSDDRSVVERWTFRLEHQWRAELLSQSFEKPWRDILGNRNVLWSITSTFSLSNNDHKYFSRIAENRLFTRTTWSTIRMGPIRLRMTLVRDHSESMSSGRCSLSSAAFVHRCSSSISLDFISIEWNIGWRAQTIPRHRREQIRLTLDDDQWFASESDGEEFRLFERFGGQRVMKNSNGWWKTSNIRWRFGNWLRNI